MLITGSEILRETVGEVREVGVLRASRYWSKYSGMYWSSLQSINGLRPELRDFGWIKPITRNSQYQVGVAAHLPSLDS